MKKSIYAYATAVVFLLLAMGCDTMAGPEPGPGADQNGRAAVSLAIAGTDSRSVLPAVPAVDEVAQWRLWGGKTDEPQDWLTELFADYAHEILYLETGEWDFTLEGYNDAYGNLLILKGTIEGQTISLVGPNTLAFTVAPISEGNGTGTVTITITLPEEHGIDLVKVYQDGTELTLEAPLTPVENQIVFTTDHAVGDYYFSFRLYKESDTIEKPDLYGVVSELVSVRQNLTSAETYTLHKEDLNLRYVITYDFNGGPSEGDYPPYYRYTEAVPLPSPLDWPNYDFKGWYDNKKLEGESFTKIPQGETGDKTFYARWDPRAPITIALQAVPSNPRLESVEVTIGDRNPPTFEVDTAYTDYAWYWDGDLIEEATTASYTLSNYGPSGIYELSVVVTAEGGRRLSARCLVTIKTE